MILGVPKELKERESRVALTPDVVKSLVSSGYQVMIEADAGVKSFYTNDQYKAAGAEIVDKDKVYSSDVVLKVNAPQPAEISKMKKGATLISFMWAATNPELVEACKQAGINAFSMDAIPRISRAQKMDALSSQGACSGYQCALIAASHSSKFFPMLTTAAGTIRPARALVIGAGVAGLQAIATCKRLGAMVEAYDVRSAAREQVESLGAKFVDTGVTADGAGGYARELTDEEKALQAEKLAKAVATADVLITTAAIPGKKAPVIITEAMIAGMKYGAVVVDMAAESGGNCALTESNPLQDTYVSAHNVNIYGPVNLPSRMPTHASELYAKNLYNFLSPWIKEGELNIDWTDEVVAGALLCKDGATAHAMVKQVLGE